MTIADAAHPPARHSALPNQAAQAFWRDPGMPFVESRRACHSRACYKPHHHPTFSVGAVDAGGSVFTGAAEGPRTLTPGTLVFVPATRVHACNPAPGMARSYQMLHLETVWLQNIRQEYAQSAPHADAPEPGRHHPRESRQVAQPLTSAQASASCENACSSGRPLNQPGSAVSGASHAYPFTSAEPVHIVTDPALYAQFCQLNALLFSNADPQDKEAALIAFIGDSDSHRGLYIGTPPPAAQLAARLQPALEWLRTQCDAPTTLDVLALRVGMSRYQLIRAFRAVTGLTPHAWQLNQRITVARDWLQRGDSLAAVAQHLGFADQAHFQRVFKAYVGVTPGQFRAD